MHSKTLKERFLELMGTSLGLVEASKLDESNTNLIHQTQKIEVLHKQLTHCKSENQVLISKQEKLLKENRDLDGNYKAQADYVQRMKQKLYQLESLIEEKSKAMAKESKYNKVINTILSESSIRKLIALPELNYSDLNIPNEIKQDSELDSEFDSLVQGFKRMSELLVKKLQSNTTSKVNNSVISTDIQTQVEEKRKRFMDLNMHTVLKRIVKDGWTIEEYCKDLSDITFSNGLRHQREDRGSENITTNLYSLMVNGKEYSLEVKDIRRNSMGPDDLGLICHKNYELRDSVDGCVAKIEWPYDYDMQYGVHDDKKFTKHNIKAFKVGGWISDLDSVISALDFAEAERMAKSKIKRAEANRKHLESLKVDFNL
jgi:hypothetical protein